MIFIFKQDCWRKLFWSPTTKMTAIEESHANISNVRCSKIKSASRESLNAYCIRKIKEIRLRFIWSWLQVKWNASKFKSEFNVTRLAKFINSADANQVTRTVIKLLADNTLSKMTRNSEEKSGAGILQI